MPTPSREPMFIVLGSGSIGTYPEGGGHWTWFLQYVLGLRALGHRVFWMDVFKARPRDETYRHVRTFFERTRKYGLEDDCAMVAFPDPDHQDLKLAEAYGKNLDEIAEIVRDADLVWNFGCALRQPMLSRFKRRVLIDVDPGHLQVAALSWNLDLEHHDSFLSVGLKIGSQGCEIPALGYRWVPFRPFVYLPMWEVTGDPRVNAPFTSITQWTWEELALGERMLSASKRAAYLRYLELPERAGRPFELAANIGPNDVANDAESLRNHGWRLADPHQVAGSPEAYRQYLQNSRAEILCPKPIFRQLQTGWFSDRSVCYLACGRPVLAEETGFSDVIPVGRGLLSFRNIDEAVAGVVEIDANYPNHSRAARELTHEYFDSARCLPAMLSAS